MEKSVAVVIPIYKQKLDLEEKNSLNQCVKILGKYDIFLVCPYTLDISDYLEAIKNTSEVKIALFKDSYFKSIKAYNKLLLSISFYKRFKAFDYILIYQLDSWIFKDDLRYWCEQDYDFIGAPWFENWAKASPDSSIIGIGNGGFSLRKVKSALKILKSFKRIEPLKNYFNREYFKKLNALGKIEYLLRVFLVFFYLKNNTYHLFNDFDLNEDYFWSRKADSLFSWYKIPNSEIAMQFSFEVNSSLLYKMNGNKLPMGCHAFKKYEPEFWTEFIKLDRL